MRLLAGDREKIRGGEGGGEKWARAMRGAGLGAGA